VREEKRTGRDGNERMEGVERREGR